MRRVLRSHRLSTLCGTLRASLDATVVAVALLLVAPEARAADALVDSSELAQSLSVENLQLAGDQVSGVVVNRTGKTVRDVRLQIVFSWLWKNERQTENDPSFLLTEIPPGQIPPHGSMPFQYSAPQAVTSRSDGHFEIDGRVLGYASVGTAVVAP